MNGRTAPTYLDSSRLVHSGRCSLWTNVPCPPPERPHSCAVQHSTPGAHLVESALVTFTIEGYTNTALHPPWTNGLCTETNCSVLRSSRTHSNFHANRHSDFFTPSVCSIRTVHPPPCVTAACMHLAAPCMRRSAAAAGTCSGWGQSRSHHQPAVTVDTVSKCSTLKPHRQQAACLASTTTGTCWFPGITG